MNGRRLGWACACAALGLACAAPAPVERHAPVAAGPRRADAAAPATGAQARYGTGRRAAARLLGPECTLGDAPRSLTSTADCLACHDGTVAPDRISLRGCHPVDVDYELARSRGMPLRPFGEVPAEIILVDGRTVGCTSCHSAGSSEPCHVAMPMAGSRLCLGCHPRA